MRVLQEISFFVRACRDHVTKEERESEETILLALRSHQRLRADAQKPRPSQKVVAGLDSNRE